MIQEYLFEKLLPFLAAGSAFYWFLGSSEKVKVGMVVGWLVIVMYLLIGITLKWFN